MGILEIQQLSKKFGKNQVIQGLNLSVEEHSIYGFIGQNGAGKTTTMKMALGLLAPDRGSIQVCGEPVVYGQTKTNKKVGYLPDVPEFYGYMKPKEYLKLCGEITGLSKSEVNKRTEELLTLVGLYEVNRKIAGFSRGMKQRLGIAQALLNQPELLICDEPTSALDPIGRKEILDILATVKETTTVVFSTHILSDVERICDHVAILHKGSIALEGALAELRKKHQNNGFYLEFQEQAQVELFCQLAELKGIEKKTDLINRSITLNLKELTVEESANDGQLLMELLYKNQIVPLKFEQLEPTLENLFLEVIK